MRELLISIVILISSFVQSNPQLDLPPVPIRPAPPKPTLQFNSYSDRDRSARYGPPYDDETDAYDKGHDNANRSRTGSGRESYSGSYYNDERVRNDCRPECNRYDGNYRNSDRYNDDNAYRERDPGSYRERNRDYQNRDQYNRDQNDIIRDQYNRDQNDYNREQYNRDQNDYNRDQYNRNRPGYDDRNPQYYNNGNNDYYNHTRYPVDDRYGNQSPYSYNDRDRYNQQNGYEDPRNDPQYRQEMENLKKVLAEIDKKSSQECNLNVAAQWEFETNVNEATHAQAVSVW